MKPKKRECKHKEISFTHVFYTGNIPCEWTRKCRDCGEVLGFATNTFRVQPVLIGSN